MADIVFDCDQCGLNLLVDEEGAGLEIKCPKCAKMLVIPTASALLQIAQKKIEGFQKLQDTFTAEQNKASAHLAAAHKSDEQTGSDKEKKTAEEVAKLRAALEKAKTDLAASLNESSKSQKQVEELQKSSDTLKNQVAQIESTAKQATQKQEAAEKEKANALEAGKAERDKLHAELKKAHQAARETASKLLVLEAEFTAIKSTRQTDSDAQKKPGNQGGTQTSASDDHIKQLEAERNKLSADLKNAIEQMHALVAERDEMREELSKAISDVSEVVTHFGTLQKECESLRHEIGRVNTATEVTATQLGTACGERDSLRAKLKEQQEGSQKKLAEMEASLQNERKSQSADKEKQQAAIASVEKQLQDSRKEIAELQKNLTETKASMESATGSARTIGTELEKANQERKRLEGELKQAQDGLAAAGDKIKSGETTRAELEASIAKNAADLSTLIAERVDLKQQLQNAEADWKKTAQEAASRSQGELNAERNKNLKLTEDLSQAEVKLTQVTAAKNELVEQLKAVDDDLEQETAAAAQIATNLNRVSGERDSLREKVKQANLAAEDASAQLAGAVAELDRIRAESATRDTAVKAKLAEQNQAFEKEREVSQQQLGSITQELTKASQQIQGLHTERTALQAQIQEAVTAKETAQKILQESQTESELIKPELEKTKRLCTERATQLATLSAERDSLKAALARAEERFVTQSRGQIETIQSERNVLKGELDQTKAGLSQFKELVSTLRNAEEKLKLDMAQMKKNIEQDPEAAQAKIEQMEQKITAMAEGDLKRENEFLQGVIKVLNEKLAETQSAKSSRWSWGRS